jgi:dihydroflavonol-4-reductase
MPVRAGIRSLHKQKYLKDFDCEVVRTELMDADSLRNAMVGVETVYSVGAAFQLWSKDPENEIVRVNIEGTRNLLQAAAHAGVKKVVYVSSMVTLDQSTMPFSDDTWNLRPELPYDHSKIEAEKLALRLAAELNLAFTSVIPGAIWGPGFNEPSPSTGMFAAILANQLPMDPDLHILVSDARDIARACLAAAQRGGNGDRYLVVNEKPVTTGALFEVARESYPELNIRIPRKVPRGILIAMAYLDAFASRLTGRPVQLQPATARYFAGASHLRADIAKARRELGIVLTPIEDTMRDSLSFAKQRFIDMRH